MTPFDLLLTCAATFRLTRLVVEDAITEPLRDWLGVGGNRRREWFHALITCRWCASTWMAGFVVLGWWLLPETMWEAGCVMLAASGFTGLISRLEE